MLQIRRRGSADPFYAPQRDLAYVFPAAMREAARGLDEEYWPQDVAELCRQTATQEAHVAEALGALGKAVQAFVEFTTETPEEALEQAGWYQQPALPRLLVAARVGEVLLGGFFHALRDITPQGREAPNLQEVADAIAASRILWRRDGDRRCQADEGSSLEAARVGEEITIEVLQARIVQLHQTAELAQARELETQTLVAELQRLQLALARAVYERRESGWRTSWRKFVQHLMFWKPF